MTADATGPDLGRPGDATRGSDARRLRSYLENLYLVTRTYASLTLYEPQAIFDTLVSLGTSFLEVDEGFILCPDDSVGFSVVAAQGSADKTELLCPDAQILWRHLISEKAATALDPEALRRRWPGRPGCLGRGLAAVALDLRDHVVGLLVVANKKTEAPFDDADLSFLTGLAGVGVLAVSNAEAVGSEQRLVAELEHRAEQARAEAEEKARLATELDRKFDIIEEQHRQILVLSTPILELWRDVVALPVIGQVDAARSVQIMETLLTEIVSKESAFVILDLTGVDVVDTNTANHFVKVLNAVQLLGARGIITGIRPAVAQTIVELGAELTGVTTLRTLREGLQYCIRKQRAAERTATASARTATAVGRVTTAEKRDPGPSSTAEKKR